nr:DUF6268 family outer membrane beta-barrel protein [Aquimarina litoralis]
MEYGIIPNVGDTQIEKYAFNLNFGSQLGKNVFGFGFSYTLYDFLFKKDSFIDLDLTDYEKIQDIQLRLFYRYKINDSWSGNIIFSPSLSSNFKGNISGNDLLINSIVSISKRWGNYKKQAILRFGLSFGTGLGRPQLLPAISFRKTINQNWSYSIGIPETGIDYNFRERNTISIKATFDSLYGNASSSVTFPDSGSLTNTKLLYTSLNTGFQYNYRIQPNWTATINLGYTPWNQLRILDGDNNELYDIGSESSGYISMGLKFNLNKMMNENKK